MIGLLLALGCPHPAPDPADHPVDPELPLDPTLRAGALPNGLRWFVAANPDPAGRVRIRLVVRAGSVLEDPDQLGAAHLVEHLAFAGTRRMSGPELARWLDGTGGPFGPHVDAHTSFDETTFDLDVDRDAVPTALQVLADWSTGLRFDDGQVDALRPVLVGEWLDRPAAQLRIERATSGAVYQGSPYADRPPGGTPESSLALTPAAAERFYRDWYRPDLTAVIAVGDLDPVEVQRAIEAEFSAAANPLIERPRVQYEIPDQPETRYVLLADPGVATTAVQILSQHDDLESNTLGHYRVDLVERVAFDLVGERLAARAGAPDSALLTAGVGKQRLSPTEGADVLAAGTRAGAALDGYRALLEQVRDARAGGIGADELERAVGRVAARYDDLAREPVDNDARADEIVRVFTTGEPAPGRTLEVELARQLLPGVTLDDLQRWTRGWMRGSRVVMVLQPSSAPAPTADDLRAVELQVE